MMVLLSVKMIFIDAMLSGAMSGAYKGKKEVLGTKLGKKYFNDNIVEKEFKRMNEVCYFFYCSKLLTASYFLGLLYDNSKVL